MTTTAAQARARQLLATFRSLSPLLVQQEQRELVALCSELGPAFYPELQALADELLPLYLASPVKRSETRLMESYIHSLERSAQRLITAGTLTPPKPTERPQTLALVPRQEFDSLQWCRLTEHAELPLTMLSAVDAAKRRNYLVESVLEPLFLLMHCCDPGAAFGYQLALCQQPERALDPDLARDLLRVWQQQPAVPREVLRQALAWSEDVQAFRHWPAVIDEADRLLRMKALEAWLATLPPASGGARLLRALAPYRDERRLARWLRRAIEEMGTSIHYFLLRGEEGGGTEQQQNARYRELARLGQLVPPLLLCSDVLLTSPTGPLDFAMAVFGFTREYERSWEAALHEQSRGVIRRLFLNDFKAGRHPLPTILRLCFGLPELETNVRRELDFISQSFDSIAQRELVIEKLAPTYSSFRKQPLLSTELGRRYRRMMLLLHEDNLRRVLRPDQLAELGQGPPVLRDLATIASESRRFLAMRRALDKSLSEIVAADLDFTHSMRGLRAGYLRRLLDL